MRDAFYIATHRARMVGTELTFEPAPIDDDRTEFIMLKDAGVGFEGSAAELRASADPYLRSFLS